MSVWTEAVRVKTLAETSDAAFDSLQSRLNEIEKETAKIPDMVKAISRLNGIRLQVIGGVTAIGALFLTLDFVLRMCWHMAWSQSLLGHIKP